MKYISNAMMMMIMMIKIQFIKSFSRGTKKNSSNTQDNRKANDKLIMIIQIY